MLKIFGIAGRINRDSNIGDSQLPVDLIRTFAIVLVVLLHASIEPVPAIVEPDSSAVLIQWWSVNIYDSFARPCVPLFVMLSGALLLQPSKADEPLGVFFKKRVSRIALPFLFWMGAYFAWDIFVEHQALTSQFLVEGLLGGPYIHFWFFYMIIGLYLVTPLVRIFTAHASRRLMKYFFVLWLIGVSLVPLLNLLVVHNLNGNLFLVTGYIGYFLLGLYLLNTHVNRKLLALGILAGFVWTALGTYWITAAIGGDLQFFFYDYFSLGVVLASVSWFLLLLSVKYGKIKCRHPRVDKFIHYVSINSLAIYLFHFMVLETLENGYLFGFRISMETLNPVIEIPLLAVVTLAICLLVLYPLRKIPYLNRLIG
jgi:surface polysaccharide O-acyltransferase-like enzyme